MKRLFTLLFFVIFISNYASAITGEAITGQVPSQQTNVSIFVLPGEPIIYIYSPQNQTYTNTSILLNYSIRNNFSSTWYNIDNTINLSLPNLSENTLSIDTTLGSHSLNLFANNSQGQSMKSIYFTVTEETQPPTGNGGSSGGGGGGAISPLTAFDLEKNLLKIDLTQGDSKTDFIKIKNIGSSKIVVSIDTQDIEKFALIQEKNITLESGETKEISVHFFSLASQIPGIYSGKIVFTSGNFRESTVAIIEVKAKEALFDINLEVLSNYKLTTSGKRISTVIDLSNIGLSGTSVDVELSLSLTDVNKENIYKLSHETLAVKDTLSVTRKIDLPSNLEPGVYLLVGEISYKNLTASSYDTIEIKEKEQLPFLVIIIIIVAVVAYTSYLWWKIHKNRKRR